jgi:hypothetical protein
MVDRDHDLAGPRERRVEIVASGPWRAPPKTKAPAASISVSTAATRFMKAAISSGVPGPARSSSSTAQVANRY